MILLERETQLAELTAAHRDAAGGQGAVVLVTGEAGIGKTAIVQRFTAEAGSEVLWGLCDDLMTPRPLGPFRDMFPHLVGTTDLTSFLEAVLEELSRPDRSVVAVVEDAQLADQATLDAIRFLGRRIDRLRALLVLTYRDDEVPADHALRLALGAIPPSNRRRVRLQPLSEVAVETLAAGQPGADQLYAVTGGNPFYVTEMLANPGSALPVSVQDAVMARVARLGVAGRECVETASTVPGAAELWLLNECEVADGLDEAARLGVLRVDGGSVSFSHELARRAVEQSLPARRRVELNARILKALEACDADPARLTHHAVRAEQPDAVVRYATVAGRRAAAIGADVEALEHYRRALTCGATLRPDERVDLLMGAATSGGQVLRFDEAHHAVAEAVEVSRASGDRVRLGRSLLLRAHLEWSLGRGRRAEESADEAVRTLEAAAPDGREALIGAYAEKARLAVVDHRPDDAIAWAEAAAAAARSAGLPVPADVLVTSGSARLQSDPDNPEPLVGALREALGTRSYAAAARAYVNLSSDLTLQMQYAAAKAYLDEGASFCDAHDLLSPLDHIMAARAQWNLEQGRWSEAARDSACVAGVEGTPRIMADLVLGLIEARRGDPAATATVERVAADAREAGDAQLMIPVALASAELGWLNGDTARVTAAIASVLDAVTASGVPRWVGEAALWRQRAGNLDAPPEDAAEPYALQIAGRWHEAASAWEARGRPYEQADALAGAPEPEPLFRALEILDRLGATRRGAMVRRRLSEMGVESVPRGPRAATLASPAGLTPRQTEILALLAEPLTYRAIAERLHVSIKTVDHHATAIRAKLGVDTRSDAVEAGRRLGILA